MANPKGKSANLSKKDKNRAVNNAAPNKKTTRKKPMKKRQNKRQKKNIAKILKWTCLIFLIVGATIFLLTTPIFNVTEVSVVGNEQVTTEEIQSLSQIQLNENTFKNFKSTIINNVKENAYIDSVTVKRILPDKIQITVEERQVKFMIKVLNSYAYINAQGYILEITELAKEVPVIEGISTSEENLTAGSRLNEEDLRKLEMVLKIMSSCEENEIDNLITSINIQDENEYTMYLAQKDKMVHLGDCSNLSTKILYTKAIVESEEGQAGDIFANGDLNNGFKPYFRKKI